MPTLEAPTIETFEPVDTYRALGVGYVSLRSPEGVQLDLSEAGATRADEDPEIAALLARMGTFIAENDGYKNVGKVKAAEPSGILSVGESRRETRQAGYKKIHLASVYHPDAAPGVIVKAYDYDRVTSGYQFYLGAWMHDGLAKASDGLSCPEQLAMFTAPGWRGHRTAVMGYQPGNDLRSMVFSMNSLYGHEATTSMIGSVDSLLEKKIGSILGRRGLWVINDLRNLANVIVDSTDTLTPEEILDQEFAIIDQPLITTRRLPLQAMMRFTPQIERWPPKRSVPAPRPV